MAALKEETELKIFFNSNIPQSVQHTALPEQKTGASWENYYFILT